MTSFQDDLNRFVENLRRKQQDMMAGTTGLVHESITDGHAITGAPGQPVETGFLRSSWTPIFESRTLSRIITNARYAPIIEDPVGGEIDDRGEDRPEQEAGGGTNRMGSEVGGHHSVKLTRAAWQKIVDHVAQQVA